MPHPSEHALGMQGDIIEIVMQALRADDLFADPLRRRLKELDTTFPEMLAELGALCKALVVCRAYTYDKSVVGGEWIKYRQVATRRTRFDTTILVASDPELNIQYFSEKKQPYMTSPRPRLSCFNLYAKVALYMNSFVACWVQRAQIC